MMKSNYPARYEPPNNLFFFSFFFLKTSSFLVKCHFHEYYYHIDILADQAGSCVKVSNTFV